MRLIKIIAALILGYTFFYIFFDFAFIDQNSSSMVPTLYPGDRFFYFRYSKPVRNGVFIIDDPRNPDHKLVKRIIGLPGEVVNYDSRPYTIPPNHYFILGDNTDLYWGLDIQEPAISLDSRSLGPIYEGLIHERVVLIWWPPDHMRWVW